MQRRRVGFSTGRLIMCGLIALSAIATSCSDDGDDSASAAQTQDPIEVWCDAVRRSQNAITSEKVESLKEVAAVAPEELEGDYEMVIGVMEYQLENPADAVGIVERTEEARLSNLRILAKAAEDCGFTLQL